MDEKGFDSIRRTLDRMYDCRNIEIKNLWQRSVFLATFLVLLFTAYGYMISSVILESSLDIDYQLFHLIVSTLSLIGILFSVLWIQMAKGSKAWYEIYEGAIVRFQSKYQRELAEESRYGMGMNDDVDIDNSLFSTKAGAYSPSKINILIGIVSLFIWMLALIVHVILLIINSSYYLLSQCRNNQMILFLLIIGLIVLIVILVMNLTCKNNKKKSLEEKRQKRCLKYLKNTLFIEQIYCNKDRIVEIDKCVRSLYYKNINDIIKERLCECVQKYNSNTVKKLIEDIEKSRDLKSIIENTRNSKHKDIKKLSGKVSEYLENTTIDSILKQRHIFDAIESNLDIEIKIKLLKLLKLRLNPIAKERNWSIINFLYQNTRSGFLDGD